MHALPFDPYLAQRRYLWRNRLAHWRQAPGETAFHTAMWLALATLVGIAMSALDARRDLAEGALALARTTPLPWLAAWGGMLAMQVRRGLLDWQGRDAAGWLAAQPVAVRMRRRQRLRIALWHLLPHALGGALLLGFLRAPWAMYGAVALMLAVACAADSAWAWRGRTCARRAPRTDARPPVVPARCLSGSGRLWRWQARAAFAGIGPRALRHGLWMLLLIPVGSGAFAALLALAAGLALAASLAAWRRALAALAQAERWLGAQPTRPRFWIAGLVLPAAMAATGAVVVACALALLGAAQVAAWVGAALFALALLEALCALALRRSPGRIALAFALRAAFLAAIGQTLMPLLVPAWLAICARLLQRGLRS